MSSTAKALGTGARLSMALFALAMPAPASAQAPGPGTFTTQTQPAAKPAPQRPPAAAKAQPKSSPESAGEPQAGGQAAGGTQLRQRVDQLEEQLVDIQVAVGTLESFAKSSAGKASSAPIGSASMPGDAGARLDGMEARIRSLAGQIEQLAQQVKALEARGGAAPGRGLQERGEAPAPASSRAPRTDVAVDQDAAGAAGRPGGDPIGGLIRGPASDRSTDVGSAPLPPVARQQPASLSSENPRDLYEKAYGHLLQQDYAAAEATFTDFLAQFPSHELAGNAQFWLGESHYVRGQYRPAANAFLKGYQTYARSQKAPDSLLKLGMSLDRLGQRDAACSSLGELSSKFPSAPAHVQSRARSERARIGCP